MRRAVRTEPVVVIPAVRPFAPARVGVVAGLLRQQRQVVVEEGYHPAVVGPLGTRHRRSVRRGWRGPAHWAPPGDPAPGGEERVMTDESPAPEQSDEQGGRDEAEEPTRPMQLSELEDED